MVTASDVANRLAVVRERIERVSSHEVTIVAVTKGWGVDAVLAAAEVGLTDFGENRAQEVIAKFCEIDPATLAGRTIHFIGQLQTNKIAALSRYVNLWQSIDRRELVEVLARRCPGAPILVQVNVTQEPQKGGCEPDQTAGLVELATRLGLVPKGLMAIGKADDERVTCNGFAQLRRLCDGLQLPICSMGMTDDLELAVAAGSTMIRVGGALFGDRPGFVARGG